MYYMKNGCNVNPLLHESGLVTGEVRRIKKAKTSNVLIVSICSLRPASGGVSGTLSPSVMELLMDDSMEKLQAGQEAIRAIINLLFHCVLHQ